MRIGVRCSLGLALSLAFAGTAPADPMQGGFSANGQPVKLTYAAYFDGADVLGDGTPTLAVVVAEKAPADGELTLQDADPENWALDEHDAEGLGAYLVATFANKDFKHLHDELHHPGLEGSMRIGGGVTRIENMKFEGGVLSGRLYTEGEEDTLAGMITLDAPFSFKVE